MNVANGQPFQQNTVTSAAGHFVTLPRAQMRFVPVTAPRSVKRSSNDILCWSVRYTDTCQSAVLGWHL